jgi:hypothetical protein
MARCPILLSCNVIMFALPFSVNVLFTLFLIDGTVKFCKDSNFMPSDVAS